MSLPAAAVVGDVLWTKASTGRTDAKGQICLQYRPRVGWRQTTWVTAAVAAYRRHKQRIAEPVGVRESTVEAHTPTQLAQEAEEESDPSEPPRSLGPPALGTDGIRDRGKLGPIIRANGRARATVPAAVRKLADHFTGK